MRYYLKEKQETLELCILISINLEKACAGKLSTNDETPERLWWEIINKIFSILITCEICLNSKDSLSSHLIARYTYETVVVAGYIFLDNNFKEERVKKFINFNVSKNTERKWTNETYAQMIEKIPNKKRFDFHQEHYRKLSNFAHPTIDSFLLNRGGEERESLLILNSVLLTLGTILEIVRICIEEGSFFTTNEQVGILDIDNISLRIDKLMKKLIIS